MPREQFLTVGQCAALLKIGPRVLSEMFYTGRLASEAGEIVGGRRMIRRSDLPYIIATLQRAGKQVSVEGIELA